MKGVLLKIDELGDMQWGRQYLATSTTRLHTLYQTEDNGFMLGGSTRAGRIATTHR